MSLSALNFSTLLSTIISFQTYPYSPGFPIQKVASLSQSLPSHSWEFGAASQALLELHSPHISVFGNLPFPVPTISKDAVPALSYAASKIVLGTGVNSLSDGDGAVGDPASLGVSAVMLGKTDGKYATAAKGTIDYLINSAPRFWNGAISQRVDQPELWADFMYMAPPFIAYYAADTNDASLLQESVNQCSLYRQILQSNTTASYHGVWEHIIGPQSQDTGIWSTGNGWAAAGMTRVLATIMKAPTAQNAPWASGAIQDLTQWIMEILDGAMNSSLDGGLVRNYMNDPNDSTGHGFGEISGSSLLASVAYRMAVLQPQACGEKYIQWADGIRGTLGGADSNGNPHVTNGGVATPAVNPLAWADTKPFTSGSPEGQAFVVLMYSAWRDCVSVGTCSTGTSDGGSSRRKRHFKRRLDLGLGFSSSSH